MKNLHFYLLVVLLGVGCGRVDRSNMDSIRDCICSKKSSSSNSSDSSKLIDSQDNDNDYDDYDDGCGICYGENSSYEDVTLPCNCNYVICFKCFLEWFWGIENSGKTCPNCRVKFTGSQLTKIAKDYCKNYKGIFYDNTHGIIKLSNNFSKSNAYEGCYDVENSSLSRSGTTNTTIKRVSNGSWKIYCDGFQSLNDSTSEAIEKEFQEHINKNTFKTINIRTLMGEVFSWELSQNVTYEELLDKIDSKLKNNQNYGYKNKKNIRLIFAEKMIINGSEEEDLKNKVFGFKNVQSGSTLYLVLRLGHFRSKKTTTSLKNPIFKQAGR